MKGTPKVAVCSQGLKLNSSRLVVAVFAHLSFFFDPLALCEQRASCEVGRGR